MLEAGIFLGERYEIVQQIGTGGMAEVYKGKDHKLNRFVAIKVLKQEFREDKTFITKFQAEAQSAAGLIHPNVVSVYDVGEEDSLHYIVMELIDGITLKDYIGKKGRLGYKEAISIAIQVCMGIEAAHKHNIIHRDIKPHNIMISKDGKVKVTDFGIARATSSNTISSNAMGSVHYTSPEQARGGFSDAKSDVYSLGITLFEMVTGQVPFDGDSTVAIAIKHLQEEITPPSEYADDIPASLEQIILKCTQKSADRRYVSMDNVVQDLKHSLVEPEGEFVNIIPLNNDSPTMILGEEDLSKIKEQTGTIMFDLDEEDEDLDDFDEDGEEYDDDDEEDEDVNPKIGRIMKILRIVMAVIIGCIVLFLVGKAAGIFSGSKDKEEEQTMVEVASVVGETEKSATAILEDQGLKVKIKETVPSDDYEAGEVTAQDPSGGTEVEEGTTVYLTLSSGPEAATGEMPPLAGKTQAEAEQILNGLGLNLEISISSNYNNKYESGIVYGSDPKSGSELSTGQKVTVYVSKGTEEVTPVQATVPDLRGKTEEQARSALSQAGLAVGNVSTQNSDAAKGTVISQSVANGTKVDQGTIVNIVISNGPAETKATFKGSVDMGDFIGEKISLAVTRVDYGTAFNINPSSYDPWSGESLGLETTVAVPADVKQFKVTITITVDGGDNAGSHSREVTLTRQ